MPQIEVRTRMRPTARTGPELVMEMLLVPRGSGNRRFAQDLARAARQHPKLKPHIKRVRAGTSKVLVVFRPSMALTKIIFEWNRERIESETVDVEGQIPLFGN
jgi:hypothetical protein